MITVHIDEQLKILDAMIAKAEASLRKGPKGIVNVVRCHGTNQYYFKNASSEAHGTYISKKNIALAAALVQRDYDREFLAAASAERKRLLQMKKNGCERNISFMYESLSKIYEDSTEGRRVLIKPYLLTDEQYVKKWEAYEYQGHSFADEVPEIFSEKGERVRSKSEKMIADKLALMKIPYRYECPLDIGKGFSYHPDFTILDIRERKQIIYEHFGRMQDEKYARDALGKIRDYQKAGLRRGENFIFTMESSDCPLDMRLFERMIRERLFN